jgi:predicted Fe-S protein YdhL (DUF1289 family)
VKAAAMSKADGPAAMPALTTAAVPSPCINVCRIEPASGLCEGCLRTLDEIAAWSQLPDTTKRAVWMQLEQRRVARSGAARTAGATGATGATGTTGIAGATVPGASRNEVSP